MNPPNTKLTSLSFIGEPSLPTLNPKKEFHFKENDPQRHLYLAFQN